MTPGIKKPSASPAHSIGSKGGFSILELLFAMAIVGILAAFAFPAYHKFIQKARETSVIGYLAKVIRAEEIFYIESPAGSYSADFDELETTGLITPSTGAAERTEHDYTFAITAGTAGDGPFWRVTANPVDGSLSARWFYADETGAIRYETGSVAGASSPLIKN